MIKIALSRVKELESSRHLFQAPLYRSPQNVWTFDFSEAINDCGHEVHLDMAAVASFLSFGYIGQSRTLIQEITRRPWLSSLNDDGQVNLETIPSHGFRVGPVEKIAQHLFRLLCDEARSVCHGYNNIYVLLSGGMDSRIIAGVLARLYQSGELRTKPIAVTWGFPDSRDAVYASQMAKTLGFEWLNVPLSPETILENIDASAHNLGLMHSPELLHSMLWFKNVTRDSLVIAGSFGDSIGRAEFSGLHLLKLKRMSPYNTFNLLQPGVFHKACIGLNIDIDEIYNRAEGDVPLYARNEHFMQGYRMRGGLCHALSIINSFAKIYQMFTAPSVYSFMWSLHPAQRNDETYASLLEQELPEIAHVPWPRTNRSLRGQTAGAKNDLKPQYHEYTKWSSGPLYNDLNKRIDPEWFEATGVFDPNSIREMSRLVRIGQARVGLLNEIWLWLAGFRKFTEYLEKNGRKLIFDLDGIYDIPILPRKRGFSKSLLTFVAGKYPRLNRNLKLIRNKTRKVELYFLKKQTAKRHPPVYTNDF